MEQIRERVAALDVHRDSVAACARVPGPRGGVRLDKARFATTTAGVAELAAWLAERGVTTVGMEATGVYWRCGCTTPTTSRTCPAARPTCPTPNGWPTWSPTGWSAPASCHPRRSGSCGS